MIGGLKPYAATRELGLPWLHSLPAHWSVRRLRALARRPIKNGVGESAQRFRDDWPRYVRITDIGGPRTLRDSTRASLPPEIAGEGLEKSDLLIAAVGATYGKSYLHAGTDGPACFAGYLVRVSPSQDVLPQFLSYWTESTYYWDQVHSEVIQATIQNFSAARVKGLRVSLPPLDEQAAIVRYLEYVDRRIRRYIGAKQRLIKLLEEQKQAIIHRAVTRGLDPNVGLKPSGVEWLGDVPEHWEVVLNQRIFKERIRPHLGQPETPLSLSQRDGLIATTDLRERSLQTSTYDNWKIALPGDIVVNRFKAHLGVFFAATLRGIVSFHYGVFEPRRHMIPKYFEHLFHTLPYRAVYAVRSNGVTVGLQNLSNQNFYNVKSVLPPIAEQTSIVEYVDEVTRSAASVSGAARREIALLREYRTRLIADVVTGKLDVRDVTAQLPDEAEEPEPLGDTDVDDDAEGADVDDTDEVPEEVEA